MTAEKGNKVYTIDESMKARYLSEGFDVRNDEGKLISFGKGRTVPYEEHLKVLDELNALKAEKKQEPDQFSDMSIEELKAFAETNNINIGNASSQSGIVKKIREILKDNQ